MSPTTQITILAGFALTLSSAELPAILTERLEYRHFAREAELIVRGTVVDETYAVFSEADGPDGQQLPFTFTTIEIDEVLKGQPGDGGQIVIRTESGVIPEEGKFSITSGVPMFDVGDAGIFFINRDADNGGPTNDPLVGLKQGFTRFLPDGSVMNELKYEPLLTDDPAYAARIHPRDIRDYEAFSKLLLAPENAGQQRLAAQLSDETRTLLEEPAAQRDLPREAFTFALSGNRAAEIRDSLGDKARSLPDLLSILIPSNYRHQTYSIPQSFLYRDLNHLLLERDLFTPEMLENVELRPVTENLLAMDPGTMAIGQVLKRNRRVMEDLFPELMIKTMGANVARGQYRMVESMMTTQMEDLELRMRMPPIESGEGEETGANNRPVGEVLDQDAFMNHLTQLIDHVHTGEDLANVPITESHDPNAPFSPRASIALVPPQEFQLPGEAPEPIEPDEIEALKENGGNPVLDRQ